uniref:Uncharacterized protein n=1 Tax=Sus scrofa TaxID=9823 RepID=A0A8D1AXF3_PIG
MDRIWAEREEKFQLIKNKQGPRPWHMESPRLEGSNRSCSHQPMPELQQHQIPAESMTYTTARGHAGSLTHRARPGIEPATS